MKSNYASTPIVTTGDCEIPIPNSTYVIEVKVIPAEDLATGDPSPFTSIKVRDTSIPAPPFNAIALLDNLDYNTVAWVHCQPKQL